MNYQLVLFTFLMVFSLNAQNVKVASLNEDGTYHIEKLNIKTELHTSVRNDYSLLDGFPFTALAHPSFKNFRNVSIADLNDDGFDEIVVCLNETLFALKYDGSILWQTSLSGTSNFPPAIADIDQDGDLEIAVQTYGVPVTGNVYVLDHTGQVLEGWPLNIDNHFFLNAVTLADLDGQGDLEIIACERISSSSGRVHALQLNGESLDENWPISIPGTPAFTPSVGDINNDGTKDLITCTTTALYAFSADGKLIDGFPVVEEGSKFSYQSPILTDLNENENLEIITTRHGDLPGTIAIESTGAYYGAWPDYDIIWNYATPAVVDIDNDDDYEVFYARPYTSEDTPGNVLLGYDHEGNALEGFPIQGFIGSESVLAIADIDNDGDQEILTASKGVINDMGLIRAYHYESGEEVSGFPITVPGFTFINGAYLSDINNDEKLDLTALSYQLKFNPASPDSAFISVFDLEVPYNESTILFNGYKGSNAHDGFYKKIVSSNQNVSIPHFSISPNPVSEYLQINEHWINENASFEIFNTAGQLVLKGQLKSGKANVRDLEKGSYFFKIEQSTVKFLKL